MSDTAHSCRLGEFTITTLLDGIIERADGDEVFGSNREPSEVAAVAARHGYDPHRLANPFVPTLVRTDALTILFDTGNGAARRPDAGRLIERMAAIGIVPSDVDMVVFTHLHGDHVGGLMEDGMPIFERARLLVGRDELAYWTQTDGFPAIEANVRPLLDRFEPIDDGVAVAAGITAVAAFGHTPGHLIFHLASNGAELMLTADTANHPVLALADPDWHFKLDVNPALAAATRRRVFDHLAADGIPFIGYHMPFPAVGRVEPHGRGYRWLPHTLPA